MSYSQQKRSMSTDWVWSHRYEALSPFVPVDHEFPDWLTTGLFHLIPVFRSSLKNFISELEIHLRWGVDPLTSTSTTCVNPERVTKHDVFFSVQVVGVDVRWSTPDKYVIHLTWGVDPLTSTLTTCVNPSLRSGFTTGRRGDVRGSTPHVRCITYNISLSLSELSDSLCRHGSDGKLKR